MVIASITLKGEVSGYTFVTKKFSGQQIEIGQNKEFENRKSRYREMEKERDILKERLLYLKKVSNTDSVKEEIKSINKRTQNFK